MRVKELRKRLEAMIDEGLGDLEVVDENKWAFGDVMVGEKRGKEVVLVRWSDQ